MSNALEQAKRLQHDAALTTAVRMPLDVLEALILEIETLQETVENYRAAYPEAIFRKALPHIVSKDGG